MTNDAPEPIRLKLDESNDLTFEVTIEGEEAATPEFRLVCEAPGLSFGFPGQGGDDGVRFQIPAMKGMLKEGSYDTRLEVILGDKILVPLSMTTEFSAPTRVTVESIKRTIERKPAAVQAKLVASKPKTDVQVGRQVIESTKPKVTTAPKVEAPKSTPARTPPVTQPKAPIQKKVPTLDEVYRAKKR